MASNNYYKRVNEYIPRTRAIGEQIREDYDGVQGGFDKLPPHNKMGTGFDESFIVTEPVSLSSPVPLRQLLKWPSNVSANNFKLGQLADAETADEAVNYGQMATYIGDHAQFTREAIVLPNEQAIKESDLTNQSYIVISGKASGGQYAYPSDYVRPQPGHTPQPDDGYHWVTDKAGNLWIRRFNYEDINKNTEALHKSNQDIYGRQLFYGDACKVVPHFGDYYDVLAGDGYIAGIRFSFPGQEQLLIDKLPAYVYVDLSFPSDPMKEREPVVKIVVSEVELAGNYSDDGGVHHVVKLAVVNSDKSIADNRIVNSGEKRYGTIEEAALGFNKFDECIIISNRGNANFKKTNKSNALKYPNSVRFIDKSNQWWLLNEKEIHLSYINNKCSENYDIGNDLNDAIEYQRLSKCGDIILPNYTVYQSKTATIYANTTIIGSVFKKSTIKKTKGFNGYHFKTYKFDELTGTQSHSITIEPDLPINFKLINFHLDGSWMEKDWKSDVNNYVNTSGGGLLVYGRLYEVDLIISNQAGIGFYTECNGEEIEFNDLRQSTIRIESSVCKEECVIHRGPSDCRYEKLWAACGGTAIKSERDSPAFSKNNSPTYNNGQTENVVFDSSEISKGQYYSGSAEIQQLHSWAATSGLGFKTKGSSRIHADLIIVESCRQGVSICDKSYGIISKLDCHNCQGEKNGSVADIDLSTSGRGLTINAIDGYKQVTHSNQTFLEISGNFICIGSINYNGYGYVGHGVFLSGNYNSINYGIIQNIGDGKSYDGLDSTGFYRNAENTTRTFSVKLMITNVPLVFRSIGRPNNENIEILFNTEKEIFKGDFKNFSHAAKWFISGSKNNERYSSLIQGSVPFDSTISTEQEVVSNIRTIYEPSPSNVISSINDTFTSFSGNIEYVYLSSITASQIKFKVKLNSTTNENTNPNIAFRLEL